MSVLPSRDDDQRTSEADPRGARRAQPRSSATTAASSSPTRSTLTKLGVLAGCWAHVCRRFEEAAPDHPAAERARAELRRTKAPAILEDMRTWLGTHAETTSLAIGKAAYTLGIWERLTRFVGDARIPLDNNATERAIRGPVVGRENHYGSKSRRRTEVASRLYPILEICELHDIDPAACLHAAVTAADRGEVLLPRDSAGAAK